MRREAPVNGSLVGFLLHRVGVASAEAGSRREGQLCAPLPSSALPAKVGTKPRCCRVWGREATAEQPFRVYDNDVGAVCLDSNGGVDRRSEA